MKKRISCAFNMNTGCVELRFTDGSICSINCTAVENEIAENRFQRSKPDDLICNDPLAYAGLYVMVFPEIEVPASCIQEAGTLLRKGNLSGVLDICLGGSQTGDGHTEGAAGNIGQAHVMAEFHGAGIAALLATDAQLDVRAGLAA